MSCKRVNPLNISYNTFNDSGNLPTPKKPSPHTQPFPIPSEILKEKMKSVSPRNNYLSKSLPAVFYVKE